MTFRLLLPTTTPAEVAARAAGRPGTRVDGDRLVARSGSAEGPVLHARLQEHDGGTLLVGELRWPRWTPWAVSVLLLAAASLGGAAALAGTGHLVWAAVVLVVGVAVTAFWWLGLLITSGNTRGARESLLRSDLLERLGPPA